MHNPSLEMWRSAVTRLMRHFEDGRVGLRKPERPMSTPHASWWGHAAGPSSKPRRGCALLQTFTIRPALKPRLPILFIPAATSFFSFGISTAVTAAVALMVLLRQYVDYWNLHPYRNWRRCSTTPTASLRALFSIDAMSIKMCVRHFRQTVAAMRSGAVTRQLVD
jgi:hypothetical protein